MIKREYKLTERSGLILEGGGMRGVFTCGVLDCLMDRGVSDSIPLLREAIERRNEVYNKQIELVEQLESEGKISVLRPERPIEVDRIERDTSKLLALYNEGYACAEALTIEQ